MIRSEVLSLIDRAEGGADLTRDELACLLSLEGEEQQALFAAADRVRARTMGDGVHLRGLIEFSNICRMDCHYCGIRRSNRHVRRYRMAPEEIVAAARGAHRLGYGSVVFQSGEGDALDPEELAGVVRAIKATTPLAVTLSVGERTREEYALWKAAGADRFLLRHETADPELFARLRPGRRLEQRVQCLLWLRELGYQVGSGFMVGLPGQTVETIADDILLLKKLNVEMAGIGPFIPAPHTPLEDAAAGTVDQTLNAVACVRLTIQDAHVPATTALGSIHPRGRQLALACGANVIMPNVTPGKYRIHYQLYPNKICLREEPEQCAPCVAALILGEGRFVATGPGHSPRWTA
ncbi:MAG: [FeFe] hydrogenase H-cluster radical SAM maturase HydE [Symbiobacterium sp.]|uniref:[FeFe] hydrogenase H-cluster radical SAM maturase HydE n=1 Tax=Symbiobacterium sp. TaxID=1971213 RepID=UPI0034643DDC